MFSTKYATTQTFVNSRLEITVISDETGEVIAELATTCYIEDDLNLLEKRFLKSCYETKLLDYLTYRCCLNPVRRDTDTKTSLLGTVFTEVLYI